MSFVDKDGNEIETGDVVYSISSPKVLRVISNVEDDLIGLSDTMDVKGIPFTQKAFLNTKWRKRLSTFLDADGYPVSVSDIIYNKQLPKCEKIVTISFDDSIIIDDNTTLSSDPH